MRNVFCSGSAREIIATLKKSKSAKLAIIALVRCVACNCCCCLRYTCRCIVRRKLRVWAMHFLRTCWKMVVNVCAAGFAPKDSFGCFACKSRRLRSPSGRDFWYTVLLWRLSMRYFLSSVRSPCSLYVYTRIQCILCHIFTTITKWSERVFAPTNELYQLIFQSHLSARQLAW